MSFARRGLSHGVLSDMPTQKSAALAGCCGETYLSRVAVAGKKPMPASHANNHRECQASGEDRAERLLPMRCEHSASRLLGILYPRRRISLRAQKICEVERGRHAGRFDEPRTPGPKGLAAVGNESGRASK